LVFNKETGSPPARIIESTVPPDVDGIAKSRIAVHHHREIHSMADTLNIFEPTGPS